MFYWICAVSAYLLGSLNLSIWISKRIYGRDIHSLGSGNPGAANTLRTLGFFPAALVFAFDFCKAYFPVLLVQNTAENTWFSVLTALLIIYGHCFPVFHRFHGGKGVACAFGAVVAFSPVMAFLLLTICAILSLSLRHVFLTPVITAAMMIPTFPLYAVYTGRPVFPFLLFSVGIFALLWNRHLLQFQTLNNHST